MSFNQFTYPNPNRADIMSLNVKTEAFQHVAGSTFATDGSVLTTVFKG